MAAGSTGGGGSVAGLPDSPRTARPVGVAWLETQSYDRINNAFKELAPQDRASCLLAILDMQNKHNVADALGNSGQLIIVTSGELGLTGGGVQLDAIMKAVEHKHDGKPGPGGASSR
jgi:hypothetical protein